MEEQGNASSGLKARAQHWLDSDLVGVVATIYGVLVLVLAFVVFRVGGGLAGMIVIVVSWVPMVIFAIRGWGKPPAPLRVEVPPEGPRHRVLGIAKTDSLMDGLREYPPNEVVMMPDRETSWDAAAEMASRVREEVGLPVTTIDAWVPRAPGRHASLLASEG
jgi:hypothetical protein